MTFENPLIVRGFALIAAALIIGGCASHQADPAAACSARSRHEYADALPTVVHLNVTSAVGTIDEDGRVSIFANLYLYVPGTTAASQSMPLDPTRPGMAMGHLKLTPLWKNSYEVESNRPGLLLEESPTADILGWAPGIDIRHMHFDVWGRTEVAVQLSDGDYTITSPIPSDLKSPPIRVRYFGESGASNWAEADVDLAHHVSRRSMSQPTTDR